MLCTPLARSIGNRVSAKYSTVTLLGAPQLAAQRAQEVALRDLHGVESRVVGHAKDGGTPLDVEQAPREPQAANGNRHVPALVIVQDAEQQTEDHEAHADATQALFEPMEDERPLQFFADAAAEYDHAEKDRSVQRRS